MQPVASLNGDDDAGEDANERRAGLASRLGNMAAVQAQSRVRSMPERTVPGVLQIDTIAAEHAVHIRNFASEMSPPRHSSDPVPLLGRTLLHDGLQDHRLQTPDEAELGSFWRNSIMPTTFHERFVRNDKGEVVGTHSSVDRGIGIPAMSPSRNMLPESFLDRGRKPKEPYMEYLLARREEERTLREHAFGGKGFGGFGDDSLGPLVSTPGSRSGRSRAGSRPSVAMRVRSDRKDSLSSAALLTVYTSKHLSMLGT